MVLKMLFLGVFAENDLEKAVFVLSTVVGLEMVELLFFFCSDGPVMVELLWFCGDGPVMVDLLLNCCCTGR